MDKAELLNYIDEMLILVQGWDEHSDGEKFRRIYHSCIDDLVEYVHPGQRRWFRDELLYCYGQMDILSHRLPDFEGFYPDGPCLLEDFVREHPEVSGPFHKEVYHDELLTELHRIWGEVATTVGVDRNTGERYTFTVQMAADNSDSQELPWDDGAEAFIPNSDALKLTGDLALTKLSKVLKPDGPIRYMRKGQRTKVHIQDFKMWCKSQGPDMFSEKAFDEYFGSGSEKRKQQIRAEKMK
jgi:hypothetical protein